MAGSQYDYATCLAEARRAVEEHRLAAAMASVHKAIGLDPTRPEAFNLLGTTVHLCGQRYKAQDYFRAAIALDATYQPAHDNLERSVSGGLGLRLQFAIGDDAGDET